LDSLFDDDSEVELDEGDDDEDSVSVSFFLPSLLFPLLEPAAARESVL
jgi:hypothetical protein